MHYIIDGYNVFFHIHDLDPSIENRQNFVRYISDLMRSKKITGEMIFDTPIHHDTTYPHSREDPPLTISYAPTNLEADDLIVEKLYAIKNTKVVRVITSDRALRTRIKDLDADVMQSNAFISMLTRKPKRKDSSNKPHLDSDTHMTRLETIFEKKLQDENE